MAVYRYVHFEDLQAQRLADLGGIAHDLRTVIDFCGQFGTLDASASRDEMIHIRALFIAAVTTYGRTLASGVRSGVTAEQILRLPEKLQETHRHFKDLRDKFVAHSVNAFEENHVKVYLTPPERGEPSVASIGVGHSRMVSASPDQMSALSELSAAVLQLVDAEANDEQKRLYEYAKSLPIEPFYAAKESSPFGSDTPNPATPRKRIG